MQVCCLALAEFAGKWMDALDRRLSELGIPGLALFDRTDFRTASNHLVSIKNTFSLTEIDKLRQALLSFEYVIVCSEQYLPLQKISRIPIIAALSSDGNCLGLSLRSGQELIQNASGVATNIIRSEDLSFLVLSFNAQDIDRCPRFDCCCCLYKAAGFVSLTLQGLSELSSFKEIEARGAKALTHLKSFSLMTVDIALSEVMPGTAEEAEYRFQKYSDSQPAISVIIPTRDRGQVLSKAVKSVLNQSFNDFELLLVNDGTQALPDEVINLDARIRCITGVHSTGVSAARNRGVKAAKGKYIAYLDDDDIFWPRHLELLHKAINGSGSELVFSRSIRTWEKHGAVVKRDVLYNEDYSLEELLHRNFITTLSVLHLKETLGEIGFFDEEFSRVEDWDLWLRFALRHKISQLDAFTAEYIFPLTSVSTTSIGVGPFLWHEFLVRARIRNSYKDLAIGESRLLEIMNSDVPRFVHGLLVQVARDPTDILNYFRLANPNLFKKQIDILKETYSGFQQYWEMIETIVNIGPKTKSAVADYRQLLFTSISEPRVSIIMPLYNCVEFTRQAVKSLYEHTAEDSFELILVDNASQDQTSFFLDEMEGKKGVRIIRNAENKNFAGACNQGAAAASYENILFLNSDVILTPNWLKPMLEVLKDPSVAIVGNKQLFGFSGKVHHSGVFVNNDCHVHHYLLGVEADDLRTNYRRDFQIVTGSCFLTRRWLFNLISGFDEGLINGMEDCDFCLKVEKLGFRTVYTPDSVIHHFVSQSPGRSKFDKENHNRFLNRWAGQVNSDLSKIVERDAQNIIRKYKKNSGLKRIGFVLDDSMQSLLALALDPLWTELTGLVSGGQWPIDPCMPVLIKASEDKNKQLNHWYFTCPEDGDFDKFILEKTSSLEIDCLLRLFVGKESGAGHLSALPYQASINLAEFLPEHINPFMTFFVDPPKKSPIQDPTAEYSMIFSDKVEDLSSQIFLNIFKPQDSKKSYYFGLAGEYQKRLIEFTTVNVEGLGVVTLRHVSTNLHYSAILDSLVDAKEVVLTNNLSLGWQRIIAALAKVCSVPVFLSAESGLTPMFAVDPDRNSYKKWAEEFLILLQNKIAASR